MHEHINKSLCLWNCVYSWCDDGGNNVIKLHIFIVLTLVFLDKIKREIPVIAPFCISLYVLDVVFESRIINFAQENGWMDFVILDDMVCVSDAVLCVA